jgi:hypothetical protein
MASKKNKGLDLSKMPDLWSNWREFIIEFNENMRLGQDAI